MAIFKCKMCGNVIDSDKLGTNNVCEKCGARYALKPVKKELADLYDRADALRRDCEFDSAESIYRKIISIDKKQADAYWGAVLCKYCVGCINDRDTHTRISICRGSSADSIKSDDDFLLAVEYGDNEQRSVYNSEADEIIRTQKEIFEIMSKEKPFDVFISYKETDANGKRTKDSDIAEAIYNQLIKEKYKVFYAPVTLRGENKMGRKYLTSIFAAVNSAKVMLAVGSKPEYLSAEWVKSEWSRFLELMKIDSSKILLPCFLDMKAADLPKGLKQLQAEDITKTVGLFDTINKVTKFMRPQKLAVSNQMITALKKRGFMALEDGEWQKADGFFEDALNRDAEDAECYLGKLMTELKVKKQEDLKKCKSSFENNNYYKKAIRFGDDFLVKKLKGYIDYIVKKNEEAKIQFECQIENIIDALKKKIELDSLPRVKLQKAKDEYEKIIKEIELIDSIFYEIESLNSDKDSINEKIKTLEKTKDKLGLFAFKEEKKIENEINKAIDQKRKIVKKISEQESRFGKYKTKEQAEQDAQTIKNTISEYESKIEKAINCSETKMSYEDAMKLVVDNSLQEIIVDRFPQCTKLQYFSMYKAKKGSYIKFGNYYQNSENKTPIEWLVLEKKNNKMLVLSKYILDWNFYNKKTTYISWENCSLRLWLNKTFFKEAFTSKEQSQIINSFVHADENPSYDVNPGRSTWDKVFILSICEAEEYFKYYGDAVCIPTNYARKRGVYVLGNTTNSYEDVLYRYSVWWLRTPGSLPNEAAYMGLIAKHEGQNVACSETGVRPAIWIDLKAMI